MVTRHQQQQLSQFQKRRFKPDTAFIAKITSPDYLLQTANLPLKAKVEKIKLEEQEPQFSLYYLRKIYKEAGVSLQKIRVTKSGKPEAQERYDALTEELEADMVQKEKEGYDIVVCDETLYTTKTQPVRCWQPKGKPLKVDIKRV